MASERTDELYKVLLDRGYPKEFCAEIAYKNMNTDYTATRMLGYLYRVSNPRIEDLVDEMLAILSDRDEMNCSFLYSTIAIYPEMHLFGKSGYGEGLTLLLDAVDKGVTK